MFVLPRHFVQSLHILRHKELERTKLLKDLNTSGYVGKCPVLPHCP